MERPLPPLLTLSTDAALWRVAGPMIALGWLQSLHLVVDVWWVGRLGDVALTGVASASFGWWIVLHLGELASVGVHARVARAAGAGRPGEVAGWAAHGALVAASVWVLLAVSAGPVVEVYLDALGLDAPAVRDAARTFLATVVLAAAGTYAEQVVAAVFRGLGDTRTALGMAATGLVVNAILDPVLIWGLGPIPALGVAGAAWATGIASGTAALVGLVVLARRGHLAGRVRPAAARVAEVLRIGVPVVISSVGFSLVYVALGRIVASQGEAHLAALTVGHRLESFPFLAAIGFQVAAATLVGQHLGAADANRAARSARAAARWCAGILLFAAIVAVVFARPMFEAFTDDPWIVEAGVAYLRTQALVWVFMGLEIVYEGAFAGAGHSTPAMWIGGTLTVARLPLAWALVHFGGLGIFGVWLAIALSTLAKGVLLPAWFARRTWVGAAARADVRLADS